MRPESQQGQIELLYVHWLIGSARIPYNISESSEPTRVSRVKHDNNPTKNPHIR